MRELKGKKILKNEQAGDVEKVLVSHQAVDEARRCLLIAMVTAAREQISASLTEALQAASTGQFNRVRSCMNQIYEQTDEIGSEAKRFTQYSEKSQRKSQRVERIDDDKDPQQYDPVEDDE